MKNIFIYDGDGTEVNWAVISDSIDLVAYYFEVSVFYGNFVNTQGVPFTTNVTGPTSGFPVLPLNAVNSINVKLYSVGTGPYVKCEYLGRFPILVNGQYVGEKFTFTSGNLNTSDTNSYNARWSVSSIEVSYGSDLLVINPISGVTSNFTPSA